MSTTLAAVTAELLTLRITSEGKFNSDRGDDLLPILEQFEAVILHDPNSQDFGSYVVPGKFGSNLGAIRVQDDILSFCMFGPLGEKRTCTLKPRSAPVGTVPTEWQGEITGEHFEPLSGTIMKMNGKCVAQLTMKKGEVRAEEIRLTGISSYQDAEALALMTGLGVNLIAQAFRIPHPGDKGLLESLPDQAALRRVAIFGGKGPLAGEEAVRFLCNAALDSDLTRTVYKIVSEG